MKLSRLKSGLEIVFMEIMCSLTEGQLSGYDAEKIIVCFLLTMNEDNDARYGLLSNKCCGYRRI